ncbi:putative permease [Neobacillus bataviensis LMG 21833]|uniref:Putative permease n=1 Tax=Neobacillus bataviensis LMG 21833 TaxID=1117379 RepID=K6DXQ9_9BACI|nr:permease [Neobacillus bataviensis]EKN65641.1 putative permease [Neobacillus bataviensis LMG 21833]
MDQLLQLNTIFISIVIEAIPFIVIGAFVSALIEVFVSENMIVRIMPKNRYLSVITGSLIGAVFPGCECGIIPITRRLVEKGVALPAAISFMLTGPIINPIVLFSTYIAFGNSWIMVWYRSGFAVVVSILVGIVLSYVIKDNQLKLNPDKHIHVHDHSQQSVKQKWWSVITHTSDEFFNVGKYLVMGSLIAAAMQTYIPTAALAALGHTKVAGVLVMMALAFILSICSEADAFVASSFRNTFSQSSITAFLVFGAMVDIKNLLMMFGTFKPKFVILLVSLITTIVFVGSLLL